MLTFDTVQKIGWEIGIPYTEFNGRNDLPDDSSDGTQTTSGRAKLTESNNGRPPMLIFTGLVPGILHQMHGENDTRSFYVLNLDTIKPTQKSYFQQELSIDLKKIIKAEINTNSSDGEASLKN